METWELFANDQFALQFRHPIVTAQGEPVERIESRAEGMLRVHILSPQMRELYFEVPKYPHLPAKLEYQQHKQSLEQRFSEFNISDVKEIAWKSLSAYEYSFEWNEGLRTVILVERKDGTYRILFDPRSPLNLEVWSTLEWAE